MCPGLKPLIRLNNKSLSSQSACKNNFGERISWTEGRKEGKNGGSGRKVIITLFYEGGRFQFYHPQGQQLNCKVIK